MPVVEEAAGEAIRTFDVSVHHEVQGPYGVHGRKLIPTFSYTTTSGRRGATTLFIKQQDVCRPGHMEAHHYRFLAAHGAPVPRLYGAFTDEHHRETLFLEYLDAIPDRDPYTEFLKDDYRFPRFLTSIAHLNAIQPSAAYLAELQHDSMTREGQRGWQQRIEHALDLLSRIREAAQKGILGSSLGQLCGDRARELDLLAEMALSLPPQIDAMPQSLCLVDCYPHCTGWRTTTGELLVFDLEYVELRARFWDVAAWLGAPDEVQPRCGTREQLADIYLASRSSVSGTHIDRDLFLEESRVLWYASILMEFGWHCWRSGIAPRAKGRHASDEERAEAGESLYKLIKGFLTGAVATGS
jgi:hypothetical protein